MNKYKSERYILQRKLKTGWSFQVSIRKGGHTIVESFNEKNYESARVAYDCAVGFRNKKLTELQDNVYIHSRPVSLLRVFEESEDLGNYNMKTQRNHKMMFDRYIGDMSLDSFTPDLIVKSLNKLTYDCTDDVISRVFSICKNIDNTAILKSYYSVPRTVGIKPPQSKKIESFKDERITDVDTIKSVLDECEDPVIKGIIIAAYYTGMRPAEIFALNKEDVKGDMIHVYKQIGSNRDEEGVIRNSKNPSSVRMIPISPYLKPVLGRFPGSVLFPYHHGGHYNSSRFSADTWRLFRPHGLSLYKIRHLFATTLEYSGVDRRTLDVLLGHAPKDSTDIYVHSDVQKMVDAIAKLGDQGWDL